MKILILYCLTLFCTLQPSCYAQNSESADEQSISSDLVVEDLNDINHRCPICPVCRICPPCPIHHCPPCSCSHCHVKICEPCPICLCRNIGDIGISPTK